MSSVLYLQCFFFFYLLGFVFFFFCNQVDSIVAAEFELEHLLLEGHCFDISTGQPPRGLQFNLGTANNPVMVDTIVMANLVRFCLITRISYRLWRAHCVSDALLK